MNIFKAKKQTVAWDQFRLDLRHFSVSFQPAHPATRTAQKTPAIAADDGAQVLLYYAARNREAMNTGSAYDSNTFDANSYGKS